MKEQQDGHPNTVDNFAALAEETVHHADLEFKIRTDYLYTVSYGVEKENVRIPSAGMVIP